MFTTAPRQNDDARTEQESDDAVGWTEVRRIFGKVAPRPTGPAA